MPVTAEDDSSTLKGEEDWRISCNFYQKSKSFLKSQKTWFLHLIRQNDVIQV